MGDSITKELFGIFNAILSNLLFRNYRTAGRTCPRMLLQPIDLPVQRELGLLGDPLRLPLGTGLPLAERGDCPVNWQGGGGKALEVTAQHPSHWILILEHEQMFQM